MQAMVPNPAMTTPKAIAAAKPTAIRPLKNTRVIRPSRSEHNRCVASHVSIRCRSAAGYERSAPENKSDGTFLFLGE